MWAHSDMAFNRKKSNKKCSVVTKAIQVFHFSGEATQPQNANGYYSATAT